MTSLIFFALSRIPMMNFLIPIYFLFLQIVSCICEFVEANRTEIRSGWRPLFGALRVVKVTAPTPAPPSTPTSTTPSSTTVGHLAALLDVFQVFLNTHNPLVFSNAAVDCVLCLLKHVRKPGKIIIENIIYLKLFTLLKCFNPT